DYAFLRYFGVDVAVEERFHSFYLSRLADYDRILDLGSGMGGFVKLLQDAGKDAYGVDSDPGCVADARSLGLSIVEADVVEHLRSLAPGSLDAVFSAHLVEHLPYDVVLEVIRLAHRALRPGGRLLLVTPNPRALVSHLEFYHQHFGHVAFYQPELLGFFMDYCGFQVVETGENPDTAPERVAAHSTWAKLATLVEPHPLPPVTPEALLPRPHSLLRRLIWRPKLWLIRWLVQPFTDRLAGQVRLTAERSRLLAELVNRPFECYAIGDKPSEP
ncbi:MAG: class I SAM-dependent methyltransferase, partial [Caldilineae bacterium]